MSHTPALLVFIATVLASLTVAGCQQDLDVRGRMFHCTDHKDCLDGFRCEAVDSGRKACLPGGEADASDHTDDTATPDTGDVAEPDDVGPDGSNSCTGGQELCSGECIEVSSDPSHCGVCDHQCAEGEMCRDGSCVEESCLPAEIEASAAGSTPESVSGSDISLSVPVLETVSLKAVSASGSSSTTPSYTWTLTSRPARSTSRITNPDGEQASLVVDLYGLYEVTLTSTDEGEGESCSSAIVTIDVAPSSDVAVQLTWNTPADEDQTDSDGANFDLHYLNDTSGIAAWNDEVLDVHWRNLNPNWGRSRAETDDPEMLVDDTDGAGPEHVVHSELETDGVYTVGVHYYAAHVWGPGYATVHIYIDGELKYEGTEMLREDRKFWKVASVGGPPNFAITPHNQLYNEIP